MIINTNKTQQKITIDSTPTNGSNNAVSSGGVYSALNAKQNSLSFDSAPISGSSNPVLSDGIYNAINSLKPKCATVALTTTWEGSDPYTQVVTIASATANSRIDLQPTDTQLDLLEEDGVKSIRVNNDNGTFTAVVRGAAPSVAMSIPCTITEVVS